MAELASMMNIGREMAKKLDSIGIGSAEGLIRSGAELSEIEGKVSECLSGAFVCFGRSGLQCGVQQPSREQKKGAERIQRLSEKMKAERCNQKIIF